MSVVDLGCGSGRLSSALTKQLGGSIEYLGIDVVQDLLDYAAPRAAPNYRFVLNAELRFPAPEQSADFVTAFSVFTHLHAHETFAYLVDARRILRPGGTIVFSYLTLPQHWRMLVNDLRGRVRGTLPHLIAYLQPRTIRRWARELGMHFEDCHADMEHRVAVLKNI